MWYAVVCEYMSVEVDPDKEYPKLKEKLRHWITARQVRAVF